MCASLRDYLINRTLVVLAAALAVLFFYASVKLVRHKLQAHRVTPHPTVEHKIPCGIVRVFPDGSIQYLPDGVNP